MTAYRQQRGHDYRGFGLWFGETAMARRPEDTAQLRRSSKWEGRWRVGAWLGKLDESDEHLLWDGDELLRSRSVRRFGRGALDGGTFSC